MNNIESNAVQYSDKLLIGHRLDLYIYCAIYATISISLGMGTGTRSKVEAPGDWLYPSALFRLFLLLMRAW